MSDLATNTGACPAGAELVVHDKAAEMAAFDLLACELRDLLNYMPVNQTAVAALDSAIRLGSAIVAGTLRNWIRRNLPAWRPDFSAPQLGLYDHASAGSATRRRASVGGKRAPAGGNGRRFSVLRPVPVHPLGLGLA